MIIKDEVGTFGVTMQNFHDNFLAYRNSARLKGH